MANVGSRTFSSERMLAGLDHGRAGRSSRRKPGPAPPRNLKEAPGAETSDRINQRHGFSLKNPASHREPQRRVTQMNKFHDSPPKRCVKHLRGGSMSTR